MKILFTGASGFTGMWFARGLAAAGHALTATLTRVRSEYDGLRARRLQILENAVVFKTSIRFGEDAFLQLLEREGPWDLLCHHAAEVANYRSPDFDPIQALRSNALRVNQALAAFKQAGGGAIVLTGSVFEPDEGLGNEPGRAFSPYGLSKGLTWQCFRYYAQSHGLKLGKFTIPNPFGPWEEPRFTSYLIRAWQERRTAEVQTPDYIRDNIPADLLAACYVRFAQQVMEQPALLTRLNPSGYVESQGAFARRFAEQMRDRLQLDCSLRLLPQTDHREPWMRVNHDPARAWVPAWDETRFWDETAEYYRKP